MPGSGWVKVQKKANPKVRLFHSRSATEGGENPGRAAWALLAVES
jgi:hypothetical protein